MNRGLALSLFILSFLTLPAWAQETQSPSKVVSKLRSDGYVIKRIDDAISITEMAKKLKKENRKLYYLELPDIIENLKRWNHHVLTFTNLKGEYIYTESPADPYLSYEYIPQLPQNNRKPVRRIASTSVTKINLDYNELSESNYNFFAHVTLSQGFFNEQIESSQIENQQNSPLTFGAGMHTRLTPSFALATSAYFSKLNASLVEDTELDQTELTVNNEIGGNIYLEYKPAQAASYSFYGGLDYEQFTTLNLDDIISGTSDQIDTNKEQMVFATAGVSFFKKIILPSAIKLSFSPVVQSKTDLTGYKYMFYINQKITKNTWYHFLFKQHQLEKADRTVSIARYGFGVGVTF